MKPKRSNRTNARVRAKVERPFRILKRVFGFIRVRYRGLTKKYEWLCADCSGLARPRPAAARRAFPRSAAGLCCAQPLLPYMLTS